MERRFDITLDRTQGTADMRGVETGKLAIVKQRGDVLVLKEAGHAYWSARGETSYAPAAFMVLRRTATIDEARDRHWFEVVVEFPVRGVDR